MKLTKIHKQRIKDALVTTLFLSQLAIAGCGGDNNWAPTSHVIFIDYTTSCLSTDKFNIEYVKKLIRGIAEKLQNQDVIWIYPIHAYTPTSSPIIEPIRPPKKRGDLADEWRRKKWLNDTLATEIDIVLNYQFDDRTVGGTDLFGAIRKANRKIKNHKNVKLHFISDMVHEMNDISFKIDFPEIKRSNLNELAAEKAKQFCPSQSMAGVDITIYLPGRPSGGDMERLYYTVNCFWEEFFSNAGTSVKIKELKA